MQEPEERPRDGVVIARIAQIQKTQQMLNELKNGDVVVTSGGITGTVVAVESDTIVIRVKPDNLKLQFARSAVNTIVTPEGTK